MTRQRSMRWSRRLRSVSGCTRWVVARSGERRGELRLAVIKLERFGIGMLLQQIEVLRARLAAEGLFAAERKRPLPFLPRTIGLVCGSDAAAKRDVIETAEERYPPARFRCSRCRCRARARRRGSPGRCGCSTPTRRWT